MTIYRDEHKVLWTRKNTNSQAGKVDLVIKNDTFLAIRHSQSPNEVLLTKDQLSEMINAAYEQTGERILILRFLSLPCPNCGETELETKIVEYNDFDQFQIVCPTCGMSGPISDTAIDAQKDWDAVIQAINAIRGKNASVISIQEELQRR